MQSWARVQNALECARWKWCSLEQEFRIHASALCGSDAVLKSSEFMLVCYVEVSDAVLSSDFMLMCYVEIGDAVLSKISKYIGVCYMEVMQSWRVQN